MRHQSQRIKQNWQLLGWFSEWKFWVWLADSPPEEWRRVRKAIMVPTTHWKLSITFKNEIKLKLEGLVLYAAILYVVSFDAIELSFLTTSRNCCYQLAHDWVNQRWGQSYHDRFNILSLVIFHVVFIPKDIMLRKIVQFALPIGLNFLKLFSETMILLFGNTINSYILHLVSRH